MGIKGDFVDVEGDGNCLYYCMLHFLFKNFPKLSIMIGDNYPLFWIRKKIRNGGIKFGNEFWLFFSEGGKSERLKHIFDPAFNYMDHQLTRDPNYVDYQGDQMDAVIFAAIFKIQVVIYATRCFPTTHLIDGRNYNPKTGYGLLTGSASGIHCDIVPTDTDVLTIVHYQTDDKALGKECGPDHWIILHPSPNIQKSSSSPIFPKMSDFAVENRSHGNKSSSPKGKNDSSATGSNEDGGETKDDKNDNGSNSDGGGDEHNGSDSNMPEEDCGGEDKGDGQDDDKSDKSNSEKEDDKKKEEQEKVKKAEREKKEKERREELERIAKQEMSDSLAKQKEELRKKEELEKNEELKRIATLEKTLALEKKEEELRKKEDLERKEELDRMATLEKTNALAKLTLDKKEEEKKKIRIEEEVRLKKVEEEKKLRISEELRLKEELERKEESERIASREKAEALEKELHKKEELEELERIAKQKLAEAETEKQLMEEEMSRQHQGDLGKKQEEIIPPAIPPETLREFDRRVHEQLQELQKKEEIENREMGGKNTNTTASANGNDFDMEVTADDGKNEEPKDGDKKMPAVDHPVVKRGRQKRKLLPKRDDTNKRDHTARD